MPEIHQHLMLNVKFLALETNSNTAVERIPSTSFIQVDKIIICTEHSRDLSGVLVQAVILLSSIKQRHSNSLTSLSNRDCKIGTSELRYPDNECDI